MDNINDNIKWDIDFLNYVFNTNVNVSRETLYNENKNEMGENDYE